MSRKIRARQTLGAGGLTAIAVLSIVRIPREPLLLEHSVEAANVDVLWPHVLASSGAYQWVSDSILFTGTGEWRLENPCLYDIRTHKKTALSRLNRLLMRDNDLGTNSWYLSPDRRRLLWTMELYNDVRVARLDGSGYHIAPIPASANTVGVIGWEDDSLRWFAEGCDYQTDRVVNVIEGDADATGAAPLSVGQICKDDDPITIDRQKARVIVRSASRQDTCAPQSTQILFPPHDKEIVDVVQSYDGSDLAWILTSSRTPPFARWFGRLFPRYFAPRSASEIWVSRSDGSRMREVGYIPLKVDDDEDGLSDLGWLPSDAKLSFVYNSRLWTVPVR